MNKDQARDSIRAIEQVWETTIFSQEEWESALMKLDHVTVAGTLLSLLMEHPKLPSVATVVAAVLEMEEEKATAPAPDHSLQMQPEIPEEEEPFERVTFAREVDPWVKGWAVSRYKHKDFRVFREQRRGYDSIQLNNPSHRTYMTPDDAARYVAEGESLGVNEIFRMLTL